MEKFIFTPLFLITALFLTLSTSHSTAQSALQFNGNTTANYSFTSQDIVKGLLNRSSQTPQNALFAFPAKKKAYLVANNDFYYKITSNNSRFRFFVGSFGRTNGNGLSLNDNGGLNFGAAGTGFNSYANSFLDCTTPAFFNTGNNNSSLNVYYGNGGNTNTPILDNYYNGNNRTTPTSNGGNVRIQSGGASSYTPNTFIGIKN